MPSIPDTTTVTARVRRRSIARLLAAGSLVLAVTIAGLGGLSSTANGKNTGKGSVTFAAFNPFSGVDASFGPEQMAGCLPAAHAIEAAGGILGYKQVNCKPVDTRGDPADAVPAADQLIATASHLMGIVGPSSDEAAATVPLFNRAHIPMFADTGLALYDKSTYPYFYRIIPADDVLGYAMALFAHDQGYKRALGVFGNDVGSQSIAPTSAAGFKKLGGSFMLQTIQLDQSSYRSEIERAIRFKPQVILTEADPQTSATYLAEFKQLYHMVPIIGSDATTQPPWLQAVGGAIGHQNLNKYFTRAEPYAPTSGPAYAAWRKALAAVAHQVEAPVSQWEADSYSMSYWDSINIMALAALEAKSIKPSVFNPYIVKVTQPKRGAVVVDTFAAGKAALASHKQIQYVGAVGKITFDKYHNSPGLFEMVTSDGHAKVVFSAAQVNAVKNKR